MFMKSFMGERLQVARKEIEKKNQIFGKQRICEMETRDLLEIATCGRLMVIW